MIIQKFFLNMHALYTPLLPLYFLVQIFFFHYLILRFFQQIRYQKQNVTCSLHLKKYSVHWTKSQIIVA